MNAHASLRHAARGFTLIEALVALIVAAFGMLALAGLQVTLSRNSDVAKQRTEATRLAEQKMEDLRAFGTIAVTAGYVDWNSMAGNTDTPATTTNTAYTRTWTVGGTNNDWQRKVRVTVSWTDRAGQDQNIFLDSVISQTDPAGVGALNVPTVEDGILRRPKARNINIPIPAVSMGGANAGKSKLRWNGPSGGWLVFSNNTGDIVYKCTTEPGDSTVLSSSCTALEAYLLTGYISGDISNGTSSNNYMGLSLGGNTTIYASLGIAFSQTQFISGTPECIVANATDQNNASVVIPNFIAYTCLIVPTDHDSNPATPKVWSGRVDITPTPTGNNKVCRYTRGTTANSDHPAVYSLVTETLDTQNFNIIKNGSCPTGTAQLAP